METALISGIRGKIFKLELGKVFVDVGSVVYEINISFKVFDKLKEISKDEEIFLYIYHSISERTQKLFGFLDEKDKSMFELLKSLSGIGESTSLRILSFLTPNELLEIVSTENKKKLEKIPKIRGKTSEKILFEIKQNIHKFQDFNIKETSTEQEVLSSQEELAIQGLIHLGYDEKTAHNEIKKLKSLKLTMASEMIREVLRN